MRKITALIGLGILTLAASAQAVIVAGWNEHTPASTTYPLAASNKDSTVTSTSMTPVGLAPITDSRTVFQGWDSRSQSPTGTPYTETDYLEFSVSMEPGLTLDPTALRLCSASINGLKLDVRSSQDGYLDSLGVLSLSESYVNYRVDLSSLAATDSITFRLYGFNSSPGGTGNYVYNGFYGVSANNGGAYDSSEIASTNFFAVSGVVVPEPTLIGCGLASACGLLMQRRRTMA